MDVLAKAYDRLHAEVGVPKAIEDLPFVPKAGFEISKLATGEHQYAKS